MRQLFRSVALAACAAGFILATSFAQQDMTKDEWQRQINQYTQQRTELQAKLQKVTSDLNALQTESGKLDSDVKKCMDELYALVGSDVQGAAAYRSEIEEAESKANELLGLSSADLVARASEVKDLAAKAKSLRANKLSLIPEFSDRLDALDQKITSVMNALAPAPTAAGSYTVKEGDCLWNISRKSDVYGNGKLWPKLWIENKQIRDPDIIRAGQTLTVPPGDGLTDEEKAAASKFYAKKRQGTP